MVCKVNIYCRILPHRASMTYAAQYSILQFNDISGNVTSSSYPVFLLTF